MSVKSTLRSLLRWPGRRLPAVPNKPTTLNKLTCPNSVSLAEKSHVTGLGPFAATPSFTALGHPSRLLNITLPAKSILNISNVSIVAIDGDLDALESSRCKLESGLEYNKVLCGSPVSLLIKGHNRSYCVVPVQHKDTWTILRKSAIVSWSGRNLSLQKPHGVDSKFLKSTGDGDLVFCGTDPIYEISIESGEQVRVDARSVIATTATSINADGGIGGSRPTPLTRMWKHVAASSIYSLVSAKLMQHMSRPLTFWKRYKAKLHLITKTQTPLRPSMYRVEGPGKLLLDNTR